MPNRSGGFFRKNAEQNVRGMVELFLPDSYPSSKRNKANICSKTNIPRESESYKAPQLRAYPSLRAYFPIRIKRARTRSTFLPGTDHAPPQNPRRLPRLNKKKELKAKVDVVNEDEKAGSSKMRTNCGPQKWKMSTLENIDSSNQIMKKSVRSIEKGKRVDPLPTLREQCVLESNTKIIKYMRGVRAVVVRLRESLGLINEETKSLILCKDALQRAFEHARKDIRLNKDTMELRKNRPRRETEQDQADILLLKEKQELLNIKKIHESSLRDAQRQLQDLNYARTRLNDVLLERNQVVDFMAEHVNNGRKPTKVQRRQIDTRVKEDEGDLTFPPEIQPLIDTPEAIAADELSLESRTESARLRQQIKKSIQDCYTRQKNAHEDVNNGLVTKVAETVALEQQLDLARGKNRTAIHRQDRHKFLTEVSRGYASGPEAKEQITTRESFTRPVVRVFHRHPSTDLTEVQKIMRASSALGMSVEESHRNLQLLRDAKKALNADLKDKRAASATDTALIRLRRRRANHRWVLDGTPADKSIIEAAVTPWKDSNTIPSTFSK